MFWILGVCALMGIGWVVYAIDDAKNYGPLKQSQVLMFIFVPLLMTSGLGMGTYNVALNMSQHDAVGGYHEFLNGSIVKADMQHFVCERDGDCRQTYSCDPYQVPRTVIDYDSKGNISGSHTEWDTYYHDCPYVTEEFSFSMTNTLSFGGRNPVMEPAQWQHIFSANPKKWRKNGDDIPGVKQVLRGVPKVWQSAHDALARGDSDPVTIENTYANYLLASEETILKKYSDKIDLLLSKKVLPEHTLSLNDPIRDVTKAYKMNFVCFKPADESAWQDALMRFNAALGMTLQGDMHVVAIKASCIPSGVSQRDYLNALQAYWLNGLGKRALAKNGIVLVLAVDDSTSNIVWSQAATGMPAGNGDMLNALSLKLSGNPFTVDSVFGHTTGTVTAQAPKPKVAYLSGSGVVPSIVLDKFPFERACMGCEDENEKGQTGYVSLSTELPLDTSHTVGGIFAALFLGAGIIWVLNFLGVSYWNNDREKERIERLRPMYDLEYQPTGLRSNMHYPTRIPRGGKKNRRKEY